MLSLWPFFFALHRALDDIFLELWENQHNVSLRSANFPKWNYIPFLFRDPSVGLLNCYSKCETVVLSSFKGVKQSERKGEISEEWTQQSSNKVKFEFLKRSRGPRNYTARRRLINFKSQIKLNCTRLAPLHSQFWRHSFSVWFFFRECSTLSVVREVFSSTITTMCVKLEWECAAD